MYTIIEVPEFQEKADKIWSADERMAFISFLANNPLAGDVVPHSNGLRKIRWGRSGSGKRGGVRVIYYNVLEDGLIFLLTLYTKSEKENLSQREIHHLKRHRDEK